MNYWHFIAGFVVGLLFVIVLKLIQKFSNVNWLPTEETYE